MSIQFSDDIRIARLELIETMVGPSPVIEFRSGAKPANCAAPDAGTVLATITCPANWLNDVSAFAKTIAGTWQDLLADAPGTMGHARLKVSGGGACKMQWSVSGPGGGGDMIVDNPTVAQNQPFSVSTFTLTEGNG